MQQIYEAPLVNDPYPHFYVKDVFTPDVYAEILENLPPDEDMRDYVAYPARSDCQAILPMFDNAFMGLVLEKFGVHGSRSDLRFVRDRRGYAIPPHTDKTKKVVSLLFYLPEDESMKDYGTGIYVPKENGFSCPEGKHHSFDGFTEVWRAPFVPNSCFGFARSDVSFHGVHEIPDVVRNVLLYNIYR
jgi:hypothetical protein